jgi:hypothetical protein
MINIISSKLLPAKLLKRLLGLSFTHSGHCTFPPENKVRLQI